jgi:hypothetical protein
MNIERIYNAVDFDERNSPLGAVCFELELQGYNIRLEGIDITTSDLNDSIFTDLEKSTNEFNIELLKDGLVEQKFKLVFTDYHKFNIQQAV